EASDASCIHGRGRNEPPGDDGRGAANGERRRRMIKKTVLAQLLLCGLCGSTLAQGYFDFDNIPGVPEQPKVQVDLGAGLLAFAAAATREGDPATADLLEAIEGIRVRVYETLIDRNAVSSFVDEASRQLEGQGWQRVVFVQDAGAKVRVYSRMDGE